MDKLIKEWETEPDRMDYIENNVPCAIRRVEKGGYLCGYVGIDKDHVLASFSYDDIPVEVHGGLTYGSIGDGERLSNNLFWFGFDCAHYGDLPSIFHKTTSRMISEATYKNIEYVKNELWNLSYFFEKLINLTNAIPQKKHKLVVTEKPDGDN